MKLILIIIIAFILCVCAELHYIHKKEKEAQERRDRLTVQDCEDLYKFERKSVLLSNGKIVGFVKA